jgi:hypothetical protein
MKKLDEPVECGCGTMTDDGDGICDRCRKEERKVERGEEERYERIMGGRG